jgi:FAD/FMN-containing dehydrogenase
MIYASTTDVLSWGRIVRSPQRVAVPRFRDELPDAIGDAPAGSTLAVGLRRSYGDTTFNSAGGLIDMRALDRLIAFDTDRGRLRAEAGISLSEIMRFVVPRGFFVAVTPGTRFVTLGGAIANDVHGKNHHRAGTFGRHVTALGLVRSDQTSVIGPEIGADLFAATVGGLGLTGIIAWAEIKLQRIGSAYLDAETLPFANLDEFWQLAEQSAETHEHTVAWIDCTATGRRSGRGIFSRGNWCAEGPLDTHQDRHRIAVPCEAPSGLLNGITVGLFNRVYFAAQKRKAGKLRQHYTTFFHPLDSIGTWNLLYGRQGFWQYQCVVPTATMRDAVATLIGEIARSGQGSFLAVLKTCGNVPSPGLLTFPMEGATLALDFPNRGQSTLKLLSRLDDTVRQAGGRLYAAKDGRVPKDMWKACYPMLERFAPFVDPHMASDFWRRVAP